MQNLLVDFHINFLKSKITLTCQKMTNFSIFIQDLGRLAEEALNKEFENINKHPTRRRILRDDIISNLQELVDNGTISDFSFFENQENTKLLALMIIQTDKNRIQGEIQEAKDEGKYIKHQDVNDHDELDNYYSRENIYSTINKIIPIVLEQMLDYKTFNTYKNRLIKKLTTN